MPLRFLSSSIPRLPREDMTISCQQQASFSYAYCPDFLRRYSSDRTSTAQCYLAGFSLSVLFLTLKVKAACSSKHQCTFTRLHNITSQNTELCYQSSLSLGSLILNEIFYCVRRARALLISSCSTAL
jgi:hypothetical protein